MKEIYHAYFIPDWMWPHNVLPHSVIPYHICNDYPVYLLSWIPVDVKKHRIRGKKKNHCLWACRYIILHISPYVSLAHATSHTGIKSTPENLAPDNSFWLTGSWTLLLELCKLYLLSDLYGHSIRVTRTLREQYAVINVVMKYCLNRLGKLSG